MTCARGGGGVCSGVRSMDPEHDGQLSGEPFRSLPHAHYERLSMGDTVIIMDTGRPLSVDLSRTFNKMIAALV